jgi:hypothetical protein
MAKITKEKALQIYEILVKHLNIKDNKYNKNKWLYDLQNDFSEIRINSGVLFFIGKVRKHYIDKCPYVSVYEERKTSEIEKLLKKVNLELSKIKIN